MSRRYPNPGLALLLLGVGAMAWGCARPNRPPGGPQDRIPPMVESTWPDTFQVVEATRDPVVFRFSERISERPTQGRLEEAVLVSPQTGDVRVKHSRSGLEVSVVGGFKPGLVYRVRVLNTIKDLFNNQMEGPFELVFSTGGEYEAHVLAGVVTDRITGEPVDQVRVEARALTVSDTGVVVDESSPVYLAQTDEEGIYLLRYVPSGSYELTLYRDNNRNQEPDFREMKGTTGQTLGMLLPKLDTIISDVALLASDTMVAGLIRVEAMDSALLKLSFDRYLLPEDPLTGVAVALWVEAPEVETPEGEPSDTIPAEGLREPGPAVERVLWQRQLDSLVATQDSIRAADSLQAVADSLGGVAQGLEAELGGLRATGDTLAALEVEAELEKIRARLEPPEVARREAEEEEPAPILPEQFFYVLLAGPLESGKLYQLTVSGVTSVNRIPGGGGEAGVSWTRPDPPPGDSSGVPRGPRMP